MTQLKLGDIDIEVEQKDIKNIHLSVYPPDGRVRIAAPTKMEMDTIRIFAISKIRWIKKQQESFRQQIREPEREYLELESHYFFGERYLLKIHETSGKAKIETDHKFIHLYTKPNTPAEKRAILINEWYRRELKKVVPPLIAKWEQTMGVKCTAFAIRKMRTKWGSCNTDAKRILLNLELAKKHKSCLEYVIVHELTHLLERSHNHRFVKLMNGFMPKWRVYKEEMNRAISW